MDENEEVLAVYALTITQAVTLKLKEGNYLETQRGKLPSMEITV